MFITRKEFEELKELSRKALEKRHRETFELEQKIDSLAKELGYEWTSEAVKETERTGIIRIFENQEDYERAFAYLPEKAVLKWSWKKKSPFGPMGVKTVVSNNKKINSKSK